MRKLLHIQFPLILDEYIMRAFASNFGLVLTSFSILFVIFTFFELIGDIIRNRTPLVTVGDYLLNLIPFIIYNVTPLCVLVAVLITFGALARSSEFTAMKAAGFSLYRVVAPVVLLAALVGGGAVRVQRALSARGEQAAGGAAFGDQSQAGADVFAAEPAVDLRADDVPAEPDGEFPGVAGRYLCARTAGAAGPAGPTSASTASQGQTPRNTTEPARIFYYKFFDPGKDIFAKLSVFEFDPVTFTLKRRIFAASAQWDPRVDRWEFENGWVRTFNGETLTSYKPFVLQTFPEIQEQPQYFKKEGSQPQEMSFGELDAYISDLRQSGFDTKKLSVQLNRKLAYPVITLVMAILAIPFALATGKRSGIAGFALAIFLAVVYLGVSSLFEAMGNVNTLPPPLAAWAPDLLFSLAGAWFLLRTPT